MLHGMAIEEVEGFQIESSDNPDNMDDVDISEYETLINFDEWLSDLKAIARDYITLFFSDKEMYCGGKISPRILLQEHYVTLVLNEKISAIEEKVYPVTEASGAYSLKTQPQITTDVQMVINLIRDAEKKGVPQPFFPGLAIMFFELCEGLEIIE